MIVRFALGLGFLLMPLYPTFILLSPLQLAGVSIVPRPLVFVVLGVLVAIAVVLCVDVVRARAPLASSARGLAIFLGAMALAALLGFDPLAGLLAAVILLMGMIGHAAILAHYGDAGTARTIFIGFLAGGGLVSLLASAMAIARIPADLYVIGHGRAIGTFLAPNECAGFLLMFVPIAFGVALITQERGLRLLGFGGAAFGLLALVLTFSRAGWIGFVAGAGYAIFVLRRPWLPLYVALALVLAVSASPLLRETHHNPSEEFTRIAAWKAGVRAVERFPLTGVGPMSFWRVYPLVRPPDGEPTAFHPHNVLLSIAAESGLVGLGAFLFAWLRFGRALRTALAAASPQARQLALAVTTGLVATWVQGMVDMVTVVVLGLWLPFMAVALGAARYGFPARSSDA